MSSYSDVRGPLGRVASCCVRSGWLENFRRRVVQLASLAATFALTACSPALNWRSVSVHQLGALLPCKPDRAEREVPLGDRLHALQMAGCTADAALFAVSRVVAGPDEEPALLLQAWQKSAQSNMSASSAQEIAAPAVKGRQPSVRLLLMAQGRRQDGSPLQAKLLWCVIGRDIYHVAVYAPHVTDDLSDTLFSELTLQ
ncbi:MAG: hypothetical protein K9K38_14785 [Rhodoferax sp.]|nr:hypothetical protein [Rhodoferax sp.]